MIITAPNSRIRHRCSGFGSGYGSGIFSRSTFRSGSQLLLRNRVHDIAQSLHGDACLGHIRYNAPDPSDRQGHQCIVGQKSDQSARCELIVHTQDSPVDRHRHIAGRGDHIAGDPKGRQHPHQPDPVIGIVFVLSLKALTLEFFAAECPYHAHTGQVFLGNRREPSLLAVNRLEFLADQAIENQRADDHDRNEYCGSNSQFRLDRYHEVERHKDQNKDMQKRCQLFRDKDLDRLDIRRTALDDISGAVFPLPGIWQGQDPAEQLVPGPAHEGLCPLLIADLEGIPAHCSRQSRGSDRSSSQPQM